MPEGEAPLEPPPCPPFGRKTQSYRSGTRHGRRVKAEDLAEAAELENACAPILDKQLDPLKGAVIAACNKLQTALAGATKRSWSFDQEEASLMPDASARRWQPTTPAVIQGRNQTRNSPR